MVIKVPVLGLAEVVEVVTRMSSRLVKIPAANTTPIIFSNVHWGVRLKSLLQFTSGNVDWARKPGTPEHIADGCIDTDPRLFLR